jgi:predicted nucleic acid-binding protein
VSAFAETSFIFAFYFPRAVSERAVAKMQSLTSRPHISSLVRYEFIQAVWFDVWRRDRGQIQGLDQVDAQAGLAAFDLDLEQGTWEMIHPDWETVIIEAERLTLSHTQRSGARAVDILHVATALLFGITEFLTFDGQQRRIAEAEGLAVSS